MSNEYWQQRKRDILYNKQLGIAEKMIAGEYIRCFKEIKNKLENLYDEILASAKDETLLVSDLYKYNHYYDLLNDLNKALQKLGLKEIEITEESLKLMYAANAKEIGEELKFFIPPNENAVKKAIEAVWCQDGKHWSDRVWNNKGLLTERLKNGLVDCMARGASKAELIKEITAIMDVGFNEADRIVRTELNYIQNQSTYDKYTEAGIQKYEFLAEIDSRTSDICKEHDGKIYKMSEAEVGVNYPPLHPNCRSTVLAVIE